MKGVVKIKVQTVTVLYFMLIVVCETYKETETVKKTRYWKPWEKHAFFKEYKHNRSKMWTSDNNRHEEDRYWSSNSRWIKDN